MASGQGAAGRRQFPCRRGDSGLQETVGDPWGPEGKDCFGRSVTTTAEQEHCSDIQFGNSSP